MRFETLNETFLVSVETLFLIIVYYLSRVPVFIELWWRIWPTPISMSVSDIPTGPYSPLLLHIHQKKIYLAVRLKFIVYVIHAIIYIILINILSSRVDI